jgi:hypothetical protein
LLGKYDDTPGFTFKVLRVNSAETPPFTLSRVEGFIVFLAGLKFGSETDFKP